MKNHFLMITFIYIILFSWKNNGQKQRIFAFLQDLFGTLFIEKYAPNRGFLRKMSQKTAFAGTADGRKSGFYTKNKYFFVIPLAIFQIV